MDGFDDYIPQNFEDKPMGGSLEGLDEYERFEVTEKTNEIKNQSSKLVKSLLSVYFNNDFITNEEYITSIRDVETANLSGLIESARYSQHAVTTLMRKIDAGLHIELQVYQTLIELQKSAIDIQMKVAMYSRTLSSYFKSVAEDMSEYGTTLNVLSKIDSDKLDDKDDGLGEEVFRGSLAMNKYFEQKMKDINERKKERKEIVETEFEEVKSEVKKEV